MARTLIVVGLLLGGCNGGKEEPILPPPETCDDLETVPLPELDATAWPVGLTEAIEAYKKLEARWEVDQCGTSEKVEVKIFTEPEEGLEVVVLGGLKPTTVCGCTFDPDFGHDNEYAPLALIAGGSVFLNGTDNLSNDIDKRIIYLDWALYGPEAPFRVRGCGVIPADATFGDTATSAFNDVAITIRVDQGDELTADVALIGDNEVVAETCSLDAWVYVGIAE